MNKFNSLLISVLFLTISKRPQKASPVFKVA